MSEAVNFFQRSVVKFLITTTFKLSADELDSGFVDKLKSLFAPKQIEIIVHESEMDETEYLLRDSFNRERLLTAVRDYEEGKPMIRIDPDTLDR